MNWLLLAASVAVHNLSGFFPDPSLAFYIARGWLGVLLAWALWRGVKVSAPVLAVLAVNEAATAVCGSLFNVWPSGFSGMCNAGTGLPVNLIGLTGAALAIVHTIAASRAAR